MESQINTNSAEEKVSKFYNEFGWDTTDEITEDARKFEDLREHSKVYVSQCRLRVFRHIPETGENLLDMASGPVQYKEYLTYSKNFKKRYCVDLSSQALEMAKRRIGDHGEFLHGSFLDLPIEENLFDCSISLHTIYHIDKDKQEEAVRKLLHVTKPGKPVIIVYSNPKTLMTSLPFRWYRQTKRFLKKPEKKPAKEEGLGLYWHAHTHDWWNRFNDIAEVRILPWRSLGADEQKAVFPNNKLGSKMFDLLFNLEERFPDFFVKYFQYPMIILSKRKG